MIKPTITIDASARSASFGDFYGAFFEDINHAADGGLYAQMVQNPSFEFCAVDNRTYDGLTGWQPLGGADIAVRECGGCLKNNPNFAEIASLEAARCGARNLGFGKGMRFKKGLGYKLGFYAKGALTLRAALTDGERELAAREVRLSDNWERYSLSLVAADDSDNGSLSLTFEGGGRIAIDAVTLFPEDAVLELFRPDLAAALKELSPKFLRFPGGCLVHDGSLDPCARDACYRWKNTLAPADERPARRNNWGYNQTLGLGYYEYFLLCEYLGCEPLPVLPAGWNPHRLEACPMEELRPWIDDALDLVEFANGSAETEWGAIRTALGHQEPFGLKYLAIGNEEVGAEFPPRWRAIAAAVREKYPEIKLIHSAGPFCSGSEYDRGWQAARADGADLVDEHYYCAPEWFLANIDRYAAFTENGPKVFLGEYASCGNRFYNAVAEAAYLTGLENAAHAVELTCYAPLFCHADYVNWRPDLIWFDNSRVCKTPNYYVQKLFSANLPDYLLAFKTEGFKEAVPANEPISGDIEITSCGSEGWIWDVRLASPEGERYFDNSDVAADFRAELGALSGDFELSFRFKKGGGHPYKGLDVSFGVEGERRIVWEIGGWQNQDCLISSRRDSGASCLDQHIFTLNQGEEYEFRLRVRGREITTFINGAQMNCCEDKLPAPRELYVTCGALKNGEIIIKAVNVQAEACSAKIEAGGGFDGSRTVLTGAADAENTLDAETVFPVTEPFSLPSGGEMTFPPLSVTVIRGRIK